MLTLTDFFPSWQFTFGVDNIQSVLGHHRQLRYEVLQPLLSGVRDEI